MFKFLVLMCLSLPLSAQTISGKVTPEWRFFAHKGFDGQHQWRGSIAIEPEYEQSFQDDRHKVFAKFFARVDQHDHERSHMDVRELLWDYRDADFTFSLGVGKVFWGVAETRHVVDIINQTDLVENIDEEDKLGQPWVRFTWDKAWGTVDLFVLPYFRERTFPGFDGRPRSIPYVDASSAVYESSRKQKHIDWALRYSHSVNIWDIGISYFQGTSREPVFFPGVRYNRPILVPYYHTISQIGTDIQATTGNWLFKFEMLTRRYQGPTFNALVGGFEYTFVGVLDSAFDVGLLLEYHHDDRSWPTVFDDDIAIGARLVANDAQSSELLFFLLYDTNTSTKLYRLEASRRLGDRFKIEIEGTLFSNVNVVDPLYANRKDNFLQVELIYYF